MDDKHVPTWSTDFTHLITTLQDEMNFLFVHKNLKDMREHARLLLHSMPPFPSPPLLSSPLRSPPLPSPPVPLPFLSPLHFPSPLLLSSSPLPTLLLPSSPLTYQQIWITSMSSKKPRDLT
eukprot:129892-Hanusia_phi.AAC.1